MANTPWLPSIPPHPLSSLLPPLLPLESHSLRQSHRQLLSSPVSPTLTYFFSGEPNPNPTFLQRAHPQSLSSLTTPPEIAFFDRVGLKMNDHGRERQRDKGNRSRMFNYVVKDVWL
ncbi:hypothetical protein C1H46_005652 [Malus baccata]|uniref:Uncharacterized protein n=1 Tax=Malus baccata TaxID=106549 RepID=A0A540NCA3_MALBA|nr:hypothetical protein C1H46_005652 [Malus baccata]